MLKEAKMIYELIAVERGHFYVCGDCKMAENVYQTLKSIIQEQTGMNSTQSDNFMLGLRVSLRVAIYGSRKCFLFFFFFLYTQARFCDSRSKTISNRANYLFFPLHYLIRFWLDRAPGEKKTYPPCAGSKNSSWKQTLRFQNRDQTCFVVLYKTSPSTSADFLFFFYFLS